MGSDDVRSATVGSAGSHGDSETIQPPAIVENDASPPATPDRDRPLSPSTGSDGEGGGRVLEVTRSGEDDSGLQTVSVDDRARAGETTSTDGGGNGELTTSGDGTGGGDGRSGDREGPDGSIQIDGGTGGGTSSSDGSDGAGGPAAEAAK